MPIRRLDRLCRVFTGSTNGLPPFFETFSGHQWPAKYIPDFKK